MSIPTLPNGHWDSKTLRARVDTFITTLERENASLREERISRHGFDCFAISSQPWPLAKITEYQVKHNIRGEG